jgi:hypothetical protein
MMVYNTQNYWVFGLCPLSSILETRKHNVSETGCFHSQVRGAGGKTPTLLGPIERANLNYKVTRKHNVSETGSVSVLRWEGEDTYSVGAIRK